MSNNSPEYEASDRDIDANRISNPQSAEADEYGFSAKSLSQLNSEKDSPSQYSTFVEHPFVMDQRWRDQAQILLNRIIAIDTRLRNIETLRNDNTLSAALHSISPSSPGIVNPEEHSEQIYEELENAEQKGHGKYRPVIDLIKVHFTSLWLLISNFSLIN